MIKKSFYYGLLFFSICRELEASEFFEQIIGCHDIAFSIKRTLPSNIFKNFIDIETPRLIIRKVKLGDTRDIFMITGIGFFRNCLVKSKDIWQIMNQQANWDDCVYIALHSEAIKMFKPIKCNAYEEMNFGETRVVGHYYDYPSCFEQTLVAKQALLKYYLSGKSLNVGPNFIERLTKIAEGYQYSLYRLKVLVNEAEEVALLANHGAITEEDFMKAGKSCYMQLGMLCPSTCNIL